jgi:hypothetical protein
MSLRVLAVTLLITAGMLASTGANALPPEPGVETSGQADVTSAPLPTIWRVERVETGDVGQYSSIKLDAGGWGWPHISYYDFGNGDLKYAHKDASGWHIETVDYAGNVGGYTSLQIDSHGQPNISYCRLADSSVTQCDDLKYAVKLDGTWHYQTVDSGGYVGAYSSLAVEGGPHYEDMTQHISYYDQTNHRLKYCLGTGAMWHCGVVDSTGDVGRYSSLALAYGHPHIAYQHYISSTSAELKYAYKSDSQWNIEVVDGPGYNTGGFSSLALCTTGGLETPRIGYYRDGHLGYAHHFVWPNINHWQLWTVDDRPPGGISFALDDCQANISYFELYMGDLRYYYPTIHGPRIETVDANNDVQVDAYSSLALDWQGQPHISFYDNGYWGLSYAHRVYGVFLPLLMRR